MRRLYRRGVNLVVDLRVSVNLLDGTRECHQHRGANSRVSSHVLRQRQPTDHAQRNDIATCTRGQRLAVPPPHDAPAPKQPRTVDHDHVIGLLVGLTEALINPIPRVDDREIGPTGDDRRTERLVHISPAYPETTRQIDVLRLDLRIVLGVDVDRDVVASETSTMRRVYNGPQAHASALRPIIWSRSRPARRTMITRSVPSIRVSVK